MTHEFLGFLDRRAFFSEYVFEDMLMLKLVVDCLANLDFSVLSNRFSLLIMCDNLSLLVHG